MKSIVDSYEEEDLAENINVMIRFRDSDLMKVKESGHLSPTLCLFLFVVLECVIYVPCI